MAGIGPLRSGSFIVRVVAMAQITPPVGVNLLALVSRARREGWDEIAPAIDPAKLARQLQATLEAIPLKARDDWHLPTLAEVTLGLTLATGDVDPVETLLRQYIADPQAKAFQVASTLRQFVEVWGLETLTARTPGIALKGAALQRARALVDVLRARLLQLSGGELVLPAAKAQPRRLPASGSKTEAIDEPPAGQLEAVLGVDGPQTYRWWRAGVAKWAAQMAPACHCPGVDLPLTCD